VRTFVHAYATADYALDLDHLCKQTNLRKHFKICRVFITVHSEAWSKVFRSEGGDSVEYGQV